MTAPSAAPSADSAAAPTTADLVARVRRQSLGDLPHRTAARVPGKLALVGGGRRFTYAELDRAVDAAASSLAAAGLAKGDRLALLSHNCWEFVALSFATARLGVVLVPVNFMLSAPEVAFILDHSGACAFVVEDALVPVASDALEAAGRGSVRLRAVLPLGNPAGAGAAAGAADPTNPADGIPDGWVDASDWFQGSGIPPEVDVADDDPVRLMYTSGTESRPKGALLSSRSLLWQYVSCVVDGRMEPDDVELHTLPLYHCAQLDCFLGPDVYVGATSIVLPGPDPAAMLAAIEAERVTKLFAPPTVWIGLLRSPLLETADLSSLRKGYYGASPMPVEVLKELQQRLPGVELWNFYGQTEMAPLATILRPSEQLARAGSAGRAALNVTTLIVDDADRPVPAGTVGEIVHRSPHATLGYYEAADQTAEAFRGGWFHSGDLGYVDDEGYLYVVDRKKDMIKSGGENVASRDVEEAIYALDGVAEVAVFGVPHPRWVESVTAVVVPRPGASLTPEAVVEHAKSRLGSFKVPKHVVVVDALPKNPSGKILKRRLRERYADIAAGDE